MAQLTDWASDPGFWGSVATSTVDLNGEILLHTRDDISLLKDLAECQGDPAQLRCNLGPMRTAALEAMSETTSGPSPDSQKRGEAAAKALYDVSGLRGVALGDYTDEFGLTGSFAESGYWGTLPGYFWGWATSPFETAASYRATWGAISDKDAFMERSADDLWKMSEALNDSITALRDMQRAFKEVGLDSEKALMGGRGIAELKDMLEQYQKLTAEASPEWRNEHGNELAERWVHILQKLDDLTIATEAYKSLMAQLPNMERWIDEMTRGPDGKTKDLSDVFDPETWTRLTSLGLTLRQSAAEGFLIGTGSPSDLPRPPPATQGR